MKRNRGVSRRKLRHQRTRVTQRAPRLSAAGESLEERRMLAADLIDVAMEQHPAPLVATDSDALSWTLADDSIASVDSAQASDRALVFVDPQVENYQQLLDSLPALSSGVQTVILDASRDGIDQITETLADQRDIAAIHILSHGTAGKIQLGNTILDSESISGYSQQLRQWSRSLTESGDLLVYGCNVAAGETGVQTIQTLSELTGADVAASTDLTGHATLDADWQLEFASGPVEATAILTAEGLAEFHGTLDLIQSTTSNEAIVGTTGDDQFTFLSNWGQDTVDGDAGDNTLDFSAVDSALTFTLKTAGTVEVTDGVNSLTAQNIQNLIGGTGDDRFVFEDTATLNGSIAGGDGQDTVDYSAFTTPVAVDLTAAAATSTLGISTIENAIGGSVADTLTGDGSDNELTGLGGDDVLSGGGGSDTVRYDRPGADVVVDFAGGTATGQGSDTLSSIEVARGDALALAPFASLTTSLSSAFQAIEDRGSELATNLNATIPLLGLSLNDIVGDLDSAGSAADLSDLLGLAAVASDYFASAGTATPAGLTTALTDHFTNTTDGLLPGVSASELQFRSEYVIADDGSQDFWWGLELNLAREISITGIDLDTVLASDTLTDLGASFDADLAVDLLGTLSLAVGTSIDLSDFGTPDFGDDDVFIQFDVLELAGQVDATINSLSVTLPEVGSLGIVGGTLQLDVAADATFSAPMDGGRISLADLAGVADPTSLIGLEPTGSLSMQLPIDGNLGVDLADLGSPIIHVADDNLFDGSELSVSIDLDISQLKDSLLGLFGELQGLAGQIGNLAEFDVDLPVLDTSLRDLIPGISDLLDVNDLSIDFFAIVDAFTFTLGDFETEIADWLGIGTFDPIANLPEIQLQLGLIANLGDAIPDWDVSAYKPDIWEAITPDFTLADHLTQFQGLLGLPAVPVFDDVRFDLLSKFRRPSLQTLLDWIRTLRFGPATGDLNGQLPLGPLDLSARYAQASNQIVLSLDIDAERIERLAIDLGAGGTELGLSVDAAAQIDLQADLTVGLDLGLSLANLGTGLTPDDAFLELREFDVNASASATDLDFAITLPDLGTGLSIDSGTLSLAAHVTADLVTPSQMGRLTLSELQASTPAELVSFGPVDTPVGSLLATLPITGSINSDFSGAEWGSLILNLDDENTLDAIPANVTLDVGIGSTLQSHLLSILQEMDGVGDEISSLPILNLDLPGVERTFNELLKAPTGPDWGDFIKFHDVVQTYFNSTATPTVKGTVEAMIDEVAMHTMNAFINEDGNAPFNVRGGLNPTTNEVTFDFEFNSAMNVGAAPSFTDLFDELGISFPAELSASAQMNLVAGLNLDVGFGLDLTDFLGGGALTDDDLFLRLSDLSVYGDIDADLDMAFDMQLLKGEIVGGTVLLDAEAAVGLSNTVDGDADNRATLADLSAASFADSFDITTPQATLDVDLPLSASIAGFDLGAANPKVLIDDADIFTDPTPVITTENFERLAGFNGLGPQQVVDMILGLGKFLDQYRDSSVFDVEIPFADADVGDVFDFARAFTNQFSEVARPSRFAISRRPDCVRHCGKRSVGQ